MRKKRGSGKQTNILERLKPADPLWTLVDRSRNSWTLSLVNGFLDVSVWDGRINPLIWPWVDGFRGQIFGQKSIDFVLYGVTDVEVAKKLTLQQFVGTLHQLGAEIGMWVKSVEMEVTEPIVIKLKVKRHE